MLCVESGSSNIRAGWVIVKFVTITISNIVTCWITVNTIMIVKLNKIWIQIPSIFISGRETKYSHIPLLESFNRKTTHVSALCQDQQIYMSSPVLHTFVFTWLWDKTVSNTRACNQMSTITIVTLHQYHPALGKQIPPKSRAITCIHIH